MDLLAIRHSLLKLGCDLTYLFRYPVSKVKIGRKPVRESPIQLLRVGIRFDEPRGEFSSMIQKFYAPCAYRAPRANFSTIFFSLQNHSAILYPIFLGNRWQFRTSWEHVYLTNPLQTVIKQDHQVQFALASLGLTLEL